MSTQSGRYICIHGHFYQPPRENPWLESVEQQESAFPFHDWNQRILVECYRPNAAARIRDDENRIISIANNYERISFNFGPTLLSWIAAKAPDVYQGILDADRASIERFSGHGSAIAQVYNHLIMPLANRRDKITQVQWGIRDFEHRFGRKPEGMWLAETAVDEESLDIMAEAGILFTILAPGQALRVRPIDEHGRPRGPWQDVSDGSIDSRRVYRAFTASGRHIDIFFYHGATSSAVAFQGLLESGVRFADALATALGPDPSGLSHIATDGETYGHHHRYGEMALAHALHEIEERPQLHLCNYGQYRELAPARFQVQVRENSAWSCAHGVGRWSFDCGCRMDSRSGWNQRWRKPLRAALDFLRDRLSAIFEQHGGALFTDPWRARDQYIDVINNRDPDHVDQFLREHTGKDLSQSQTCMALQLLEMQRHAQLMYTSCGWFFDEFTGPEGTQVLRYAARAAELGEWISGTDVEARFVDMLADMHSNIPEFGDGRQAYDRLVRPAKVDLRRVVAHHAISLLFERHEQHERLHCYDVEAEDVRVAEAGRAKLAVGIARSTSIITRATSTLSFGVLHLGDHNLAGGARYFAGAEKHQAMVTDVTEAFDRADLVATQRHLDSHFHDLRFSLDSLFPDHRQRMLERILEIPLAEAEAAYSQVYTHHAPLMRYLANLDLPIPDAFKTAARFLLQLRLGRAFGAARPDLDEVRAIIEQATFVSVELADSAMNHLVRQSLEGLVTELYAHPEDMALLEAMTALAELIHENHWPVDLWYTQNQCFKLLQKERTGREHPGEDAERESRDALIDRLCRAIGIAT